MRTTTDHAEGLENGSGGDAPGLLSKTRTYLTEELTTSWGDAILILSCFTTGLLDSAVFNVWSCFVSMQTGNTVYAGLGVSGQPKSQPYRWAKSLTSIFAFVLGAFLYSRLMRSAGPMKRVTLVGCFLSQAILTFVAAGLVESGTVPSDAGDLLPDDFIVVLPIALLALQSAGQIVVSRVLGVGEVTTVVLTSAYCDLFFDQEVLTAPLTENVKRNRRVASVLMLAAGAVAGGFLTRGGDIALALWVAGGIKLAVSAVWLGWRKEDKGVRLE